MALGTVTVKGRFNHDGRPTMNDIISFAGDAAYPAGGIPNFRALVRQAVGRGSLDIVYALLLNGSGQVYYDRATDKLKIFTAEGAETSGDTSGTTFELLVVSV
jgi:hypothetical protein